MLFSDQNQMEVRRFKGYHDEVNKGMCEVEIDVSKWFNERLFPGKSGFLPVFERPNDIVTKYVNTDQIENKDGTPMDNTVIMTNSIAEIRAKMAEFRKSLDDFNERSKAAANEIFKSYNDSLAKQMDFEKEMFEEMEDEKKMVEETEREEQSVDERREAHLAYINQDLRDPEESQRSLDHIREMLKMIEVNDEDYESSKLEEDKEINENTKQDQDNSEEVDSVKEGDDDSLDTEEPKRREQSVDGRSKAQDLKLPEESHIREILEIIAVNDEDYGSSKLEEDEEINGKTEENQEVTDKEERTRNVNEGTDDFTEKDIEEVKEGDDDNFENVENTEEPKVTKREVTCTLEMQLAKENE